MRGATSVAESCSELFVSLARFCLTDVHVDVQFVGQFYYFCAALRMTAIDALSPRCSLPIFHNKAKRLICPSLAKMHDTPEYSSKKTFCIAASPQDLHIAEPIMTRLGAIFTKVILTGTKAQITIGHHQGAILHSCSIRTN